MPATRPLVVFVLGAMACIPAFAQTPQTPAATDTEAVSLSPARFNDLADSALLTMRKKAEAASVEGVAVLAYFSGDKAEAWTSKMVVVGHIRKEPSATDKGSNLLAIAYAKASEMADTLKNSGSQVRPPMTGEFGWEGGVIVHLKTGYLIAAFSGGQSSDDVAISRAGAARVLEQLKPAN